MAMQYSPVRLDQAEGIYEKVIEELIQSGRFDNTKLRRFADRNVDAFVQQLHRQLYKMSVDYHRIHGREQKPTDQGKVLIRKAEDIIDAKLVEYAKRSWLVGDNEDEAWEFTTSAIEEARESLETSVKLSYSEERLLVERTLEKMNDIYSTRKGSPEDKALADVVAKSLEASINSFKRSLGL